MVIIKIMKKTKEMLMKEGTFGRQSKASLKCIDLIGSPHRPHRQNTQTIAKSEISKLLRLLLPYPVVHFDWTIEVLIGYHLMEPFLGIMLDLQPRPTHLALHSVFQNLHKQMMEPIPGLQFSSVMVSFRSTRSGWSLSPSIWNLISLKVLFNCS